MRTPSAITLAGAALEAVVHVCGQPAKPFATTAPLPTPLVRGLPLMGVVAVNGVAVPLGTYNAMLAAGALLGTNVNGVHVPTPVAPPTPVAAPPAAPAGKGKGKGKA